MGLPIADIQHENPRGVGKGRLLTLSCLSRASARGRQFAEFARILAIGSYLLLCVAIPFVIFQTP
jgi:hypothetical protein